MKTLPEILDKFGSRAISAAHSLYSSEEEAKQDAIEAIAKELMGCLPEKDHIHVDDKFAHGMTNRDASLMIQSRNQTIDEVRARLTAFIGEEKK